MAMNSTIIFRRSVTSEMLTSLHQRTFKLTRNPLLKDYLCCFCKRILGHLSKFSQVSSINHSQDSQGWHNAQNKCSKARRHKKLEEKRMSGVSVHIKNNHWSTEVHLPSLKFSKTSRIVI